MPKQSTVRMNANAKRKLDKLQAETDLSQPALLDRAVELLEREMLAQRLASDFADVAADPEVLRKYNKIADVFDGAAGDGLRRREP